MLCVIWLLVMRCWFVVNSAPKYLQQLIMDLVTNPMSMFYCEEQLEPRATVSNASANVFIIAWGIPLFCIVIHWWVLWLSISVFIQLFMLTLKNIADPFMVKKNSDLFPFFRYFQSIAKWNTKHIHQAKKIIHQEDVTLFIRNPIGTPSKWHPSYSGNNRHRPCQNFDDNQAVCGFHIPWTNPRGSRQHGGVHVIACIVWYVFGFGSSCWIIQIQLRESILF